MRKDFVSEAQGVDLGERVCYSSFPQSRFENYSSSTDAHMLIMCGIVVLDMVARSWVEWKYGSILPTQQLCIL